LTHHLTSEFSGRTLASFTRTELQDFLDRKTLLGLSFSTVDHLRWDLKQIFDLAVTDDYLRKNPAAKLLTPKEAKRVSGRVMVDQDVWKLFSVLETREQLVCRLALIAGMRPGEIFGLKWRHVKGDYVEIEQRLYRGQIDTPKNESARSAAVSEEIKALIAQWRDLCGNPEPDAWVFPSENLRTPIFKDNLWRRCIAPRLAEVGLEWVNFQVMRRTHATMQHRRNVDPKITADQLGHSVDVDLNVYTKTPLGVRKEAVDALETALRVM
jgi:integrase